MVLIQPPEMRASGWSAAFSPPANGPPANGLPANGPPANGPPAKIHPLAANRPPVDCNCQWVYLYH